MKLEAHLRRHPRGSPIVQRPSAVAPARVATHLHSGGVPECATLQPQSHGAAVVAAREPGAQHAQHGAAFLVADAVEERLDAIVVVDPCVQTSQENVGEFLCSMSGCSVLKARNTQARKLST